MGGGADKGAEEAPPLGELSAKPTEGAAPPLAAFAASAVVHGPPPAAARPPPPMGEGLKRPP